MPYTKNVWASGDVITATKLNNAETGIETVDTTKAPIANPVFTGIPKVGTATMITTDNIATYAPPPANYDDDAAQVNIFVGAGQAFTTIQSAINALKKVNAGKRDIILTGGTTFTENVTIAGFHGGKISVRGASACSLNGNITISDNSADINMELITITNNGFINVTNAGFVSLYQINKTVAGTNGISLSNGNFTMSTCTFSNQSGIAIEVYGGAILVMNTVTGTGNGTALVSRAAIIMMDAASTITGTTPQSKSNGGQIFA